jgi:hypothetical protein
MKSAVATQARVSARPQHTIFYGGKNASQPFLTHVFLAVAWREQRVIEKCFVYTKMKVAIGN